MKSSGDLLHFVAFFHVASLFSRGVDNKKVGIDNEKGKGALPQFGHKYLRS